MKEPLIVLTGPTAAGKTDLSIQLAKAIGGEIISADSMQVYKYMDIGTAKIRPEEMEGVTHYLVDALEPDEPFNVVIFQQMAREAMTRIRQNGHIPIIVGGTGFYIQAVLNDIDFKENDDDTSFRHALETMAAAGGGDRLYAMLQEVDPEAAEKIHCHNTKKVIRALEYYHQTGQKISEHNAQESMKQSPYNFAYFVLNRPRELLYQRIDRRVDEMLEQGLVDEVRGLRDRGYTRELVSMQGLGYKEILAYLDQEMTLEEAVYVLKRDTRHFAKRQLTWFKRERDVLWINQSLYASRDDILADMIHILRQKGIIPS
ncbi:MAG: tRNA (adenosine(37)-N6)-dimethylallyltransferase MiaA [Coprococcus sp.]